MRRVCHNVNQMRSCLSCCSSQIKTTYFFQKIAFLMSFFFRYLKRSGRYMEATKIRKKIMFGWSCVFWADCKGLWYLWSPPAYCRDEMVICGEDGRCSRGSACRSPSGWEGEQVKRLKHFISCSSAWSIAFL